MCSRAPDPVPVREATAAPRRGRHRPCADRLFHAAAGPAAACGPRPASVPRRTRSSTPGRVEEHLGGSTRSAVVVGAGNVALAVKHLRRRGIGPVRISTAASRAPERSPSAPAPSTTSSTRARALSAADLVISATAPRCRAARARLRAAMDDATADVRARPRVPRRRAFGRLGPACGSSTSRPRATLAARGRDPEEIERPTRSSTTRSIGSSSGAARAPRAADPRAARARRRGRRRGARAFRSELADLTPDEREAVAASPRRGRQAPARPDRPL